MKKFGVSILVIVLVGSLVFNIYSYYQIKEFKNHQELQYMSNVNHFYGHIYDMNRYLDTIINEELKSEPNIITIAKYSSKIKNANWRVQELANDIAAYEEDHETGRLVRYLFGIYFGDEINQLELTLHNNKELFEVASKIKSEVNVVIESLPKTDNEYKELSKEDEFETWIEIVNQLPDSEALNSYKEFVNFDRLEEHK